MAIKDFIKKDSYSRIERVDVMKDTKTVDFYLTVYKNSDKSEVVTQGVRFSACNDPVNDKHDYDDIFEDALKQDINILGICYLNLMSRPEFANTSEV